MVEPGLPGRGHEEAGDLRGRPDVIEHRNPRAGPLLLHQTGGTQGHRRRGRRLGHRHGQANRVGQSSQSDPVQIEDLGDVGAHVEGAPVTGDAQHGGQTVVLQAAQFLFQHDAVPVAAGQVTQGRAPASATSRASRVGGKSGRSWWSPTSTASQLGANTRAVAASVAASAGGALRSVRTSRCRVQRGHHSELGHLGQRGEAHGMATISQPPSGRTPPQGPNTIFFGQAADGNGVRTGADGTPTAWHGRVASESLTYLLPIAAFLCGRGAEDPLYVPERRPARSSECPAMTCRPDEGIDVDGWCTRSEDRSCECGGAAGAARKFVDHSGASGSRRSQEWRGGRMSGNGSDQ